MKNLIWCLLLCTTNWVQAQDPYAILEAITAAYANKSGLSYQVHYEYYEDQEATVPQETMAMTVATKGEAYYVQYNDYILIGDGKNHLVIDHLNRSIRSMAFARQKTMMEVRQFQEMAKTMGLQLRVFQPRDPTYSGLEFTAPDKSGSKIQLVYDANSFRLVSSSIRVKLTAEQAQEYISQNMRMEVSYSDYKEIKGRFPYRLADLEREYVDYLMIR